MGMGKFNDIYDSMKLQHYNIIRGDQITAGYANPITGAENYHNYGVNLSPDIARQAQAREYEAAIDAATRRYVADRSLEASKYGADTRGQGREYLNPWAKDELDTIDREIADISRQIASAERGYTPETRVPALEEQRAALRKKRADIAARLRGGGKEETGGQQEFNWDRGKGTFR
jgi:hypothetical protein